MIDKQPKLAALKESEGRKEYFSREQVGKLVFNARDIFGDNEIADAMLFAVYTGCRQAQILKLEVGHIDLVHDRLTLVDTKNGEDQVLDIHPKMREMLEMRCSNEQPNAKVFSFDNKDDLWGRFKKVRRATGISEKYVWHTFRHTTGTWLAEAGVPIQSIAKVLGHKTLEMSQRYTKITDQARKDAINKL